MTGKELILKAMKFEKTPRLPVAILDGYVWMLKRKGLSFKDLAEMEDCGASVAIEGYDDMGSDMVTPNIHSFNHIFEVMGGTVSWDKKGEPFEIIVPPLKEMSDIERYNIDEVWEKLLDHPGFTASARQLDILKAHYGDEKLVVAMGVGPLSLAAMLVGTQNFMTEIYGEEELAEKMLGFATEFIIRHAEMFIAHGADAIFLADPVASGDLISPAMFEQYALPYVQKVTSSLKKYDLPIMLHMCGHTAARLEPLKRAGINAFSLAAVDLKEALDTARGEYAIFGNMDPFAILQSKSEEEVYNICRELGAVAGLEGGYVMMPGCDLAPATALENIQAMARAAHDTTD